MSTDKEKLIAMFKEFFGNNYSTFIIEIFAKKLIANGVVVREKGEWIWDKKFGDYKCSICGGYDITEPAFCRTCGADMRGVNDD